MATGWAASCASGGATSDDCMAVLPDDLESWLIFPTDGQEQTVVVPGDQEAVALGLDEKNKEERRVLASR